jgi:hypothetical protein
MLWWLRASEEPMGADTFGTRAKGKTAEEAFRSAVENAQWEHGHGGYSGTIAEKRSFTIIAVPQGMDCIEYANSLLDGDDPRVSDKWGPAGCVKLDEGTWYFFGWASL